MRKYEIPQNFTLSRNIQEILMLHSLAQSLSFWGK